MPPKGGFNDGREAKLHQYVLAQHPKSAAEVLQAIDEYTASHGRLMTFQQPKVDAARKVLEALDPKPKVLVELGGYVGKSAVAWGDMLRTFNQSESLQGVKVFSLELEPNFVSIIRDLVDVAGLGDIVTVLEGESPVSIQRLRPELGIETVDVLFLDHWEKFYLSDLRLCESLKLLRKGSVVVADNTDKPGAPEYLAYVEAGGEGGWKYRCESVRVPADNPGAPNIVHFAFVEETPE